MRDDEPPAEPEPAEPEDPQTSVYEQRILPAPEDEPDADAEAP